MSENELATVEQNPTDPPRVRAVGELLHPHGGRDDPQRD